MRPVINIGAGAFSLLVCASTLARADSTSVHVFTDTTSVRIEVVIPSAGKLIGRTLNGIITSGSDFVLWKGAIGLIAPDSVGAAHLSAKIDQLHPRLWSPATPNLYSLTVWSGEGRSGVTRLVRFGFRSVASSNGQFLLNGRPLFLRGNAINPPGRNIPDSLEENRRFVVAYVRFLKSINVNIIRLTRTSQVWLDVCDELGMMLFQGNYGTPAGGTPSHAPNKPLKESLDWYHREVVDPLVNHPSVVIYVLSNEQADSEVPYLNAGAAGINRFLATVYDSLRTWDRSRLYIANAGYGFGRVGEVCDLHRYWGWYYNSFLSFYTLRDPRICWRSEQAQPITMTENTGNYTGVDGRFNLVPNTKQPDSQLNWTGHSPDSEQSARALGYQAWMAGQAIEIYRRSREINPALAGLSPFTILFHNWWGISRFEDMKAKPIAAQFAVSYQPVLLSWEFWTPNVYAGSTISPVAHVVNDGEDAADLTKLSLHYSLVGPDGRSRLNGTTSLSPVRYYAATSRTVDIVLPDTLPPGSHDLVGWLMRGGDTISRNVVSIFIQRRRSVSTAARFPRRVLLYDAAARHSASALRKVGIASTLVSSLAGVTPRDLLVIGAEAWDDALARQTSRLRAFIESGGRLLILHQNPRQFDGTWLPAPISLQNSELDHSKIFPGGRPFGNGMAVNPERPGHPVFSGLARDRFFLWSDFTRWTEKTPGFPQVYPVTSGFVVTNPDSMGKVAVLANYDHGLEGIALAELFDGAGSAILSGLNMIDRAGLDPVSDSLLINIVRYMASESPHYSAPLIESKIVWGDYESERGLLTGIYSGLLLNTVPRVPADLVSAYPVSIDSNGYTFAGGTSGWNTKPSIQYVPHGRRVFGPYTFSSGGSVELRMKSDRTGKGRVWMRVPDSRSAMVTTILNPIPEALEMEIGVNGATSRSTIPGASTVTIENHILGGRSPLAVTFRGDRRLVILETDFR